MEETYKKGDLIAKMGEPSDYMLVILKGQADVLTRSGQQVCRLQAGATIGEVCALGLMDTSTANVRAASKSCGILKVSAGALQRAFERQPDNKAKETFGKICERRQNQGNHCLPMSLLQGVSIKVDDISACVISMQAQMIPLEAGEYWEPLPADDLSGKHIGIFAKGSATLEISKFEYNITRLKECSMFPEDLLHKRGVRVKALSACVGYRIRMTDFDLATRCIQGLPSHGPEWLTRFHMLEAATYADLVRRLDSADGVTAGVAPHPNDPEIHKWRARKKATIDRAKVMRSERLDLPSAIDPRGGPQEDVSFETSSALSGRTTKSTERSSATAPRTAPRPESGTSSLLSASAPCLLQPMRLRKAKPKLKLPRLAGTTSNTALQLGDETVVTNY
jgi:hypothetical protein